MKHKPLRRIKHLSDRELLAKTRDLVGAHQRLTAELLEHLAEMDHRKLFLQEGCPSLFIYCVEVLHLAEGAAYRRITAARLSRRFPVILEHVAGGSLHLTALTLLAPHLTPENHRQVLRRARHMSKKQVEVLVAKLAPKPPVATSVRKLPQGVVGGNGVESGGALWAVGGAGGTLSSLEDRGAGESPVSRDPHPPRARALAEVHYKVSFTADPETMALLKQAQDLLRHQMPASDPAEIMKLALRQLVATLEAKKCARVCRPRALPEDSSTNIAKLPLSPTSRHIPSAVKRQVWTRDRARCAFVAANGRRCSETGFLEYHHVTPYARGGNATAANIQLRCRAHNVYEAGLEFGGWRPDRVRESEGGYWVLARAHPASPCEDSPRGELDALAVLDCGGGGSAWLPIACQMVHRFNGFFEPVEYYVFCFFFSAAGNNTLLRINR